MALPPSAAASLLGPGGAGPSAPPSPLQATLSAFFDHETGEMGAVTDFKSFALPLARIKKIMKSDEDVRMISSEAPALFSKACELFIQELTLRAWVHADGHKRRTLSRADVANAIAKTDVFDFLLDIVPHDGGPKREAAGGAGAAAAEAAEGEPEDEQDDEGR